MKILIFSHSSNFGGAEKALRYLVEILKKTNEVHMVFPKIEGTEVVHYSSIGVKCFHLHEGFSLPHFSTTIFNYSKLNLQHISESLSLEKYDLMITNTIAILHGALIASQMKIPHIFYAHEYLKDNELLPTSISKEFYLEIVGEGALKILPCSNYVATQFSKSSKFIIQPFDYAQNFEPRKINNSDEYIIQLIGTISQRKNIEFGINIVKSLKEKGVNVRLDLFGSEGDASKKIRRLISKRNINAKFHGMVSNPYEVNINNKVVTLICSKNEPFGLTIPESIRIGIPVLSTDSAGASDILPENFKYKENDLDDACRKIKNIFLNYHESVNNCHFTYQNLNNKFNLIELEDIVTNFMIAVAESGEYSPMPTLRKIVDNIPYDINKILGFNDILKNIVLNSPTTTSIDSLIDSVMLEKNNPGLAVKSDVEKYEVIPYVDSPEMSELYKRGIGLAIELASTYDEPARLHMASYIYCVLTELQIKSLRKIKILALGDGIGVDSIRLAKAGFDVVYMDYDESVMSEIAKSNINDAIKNDNKLNISVINKVEEQYDAVICLEVIEHVPDPLIFIESIASYLIDGGLLLISDCFNGIESRWPTHLASNEKYSGLFPFLAVQNFELINYNRLPFAKPYLLKKNKGNSSAKIMKLFEDNNLINNMINNQQDIGC
jgi:glycosyltransferase involved in cell wall biosynthesis/SAM-dependent methyltransferase